MKCKFYILHKNAYLITFKALWKELQLATFFYSRAANAGSILMTNVPQSQEQQAYNATSFYKVTIITHYTLKL